MRSAVRQAVGNGILRLSALAAAGMLLAACGMGGGGGAYGGSGAGGGAGAAASPSGGGKPKLTILTPKDGATVTAPVKLTYNTNVPIGPTDSGKDHVHVFLDGKTQDYTVVPMTTYMVKNLPSGKHTIGVTLQHADHSPAGASAQVTVTVKGGGASSSPTGTSGGGNGPYNY